MALSDIYDLCKQYRNYFFFIPYGIYSVVNTLLRSTAEIPSYWEPLSKLLLGMVLVKIVCTPISGYWKRLVIYLFTVTSLVIWYVSGVNLVLYLMLITLGAVDIDVHQLIKANIVIVGALIVILLALSVAGIIENRTFPRAGSSIVRYAFGITYPTDFAAHVVYVFGFIGVFVQKKWAMIYRVSGVGIGIFIYMYSHARLDSISMLLLLIGYGVIDHQCGRKYIRRFGQYSMVCMLVLSVLMVYLYGQHTEQLMSFDTLISGRLELTYRAIQQYGITWHGQQIIFKGFGQYLPGLSYNFVDNAYFQLLLINGVVYTVMLVGLQTFLACQFKRYRYDKLLVMFSVLAVHGLIAHHLFNMVYNPLWIAVFGSVLSDKLPKIKEIRRSDSDETN